MGPIAQQLEFDFEFGCPGVEAEYYREGAEDLIRRLVPSELLVEKGGHLPSQRARFADLMPFISWSDLSRAPCTLSVLLLCRYRLNGCNFFYEMISRWLLPQKSLNVELFFASDVHLPHLSEDVLSVAEIVVHLKSAQDVEEVKRNLSTIETEIRLGIGSAYHARRILEFKGLSSDGKTAMIQEKIGSLIQSHSKDFDRGIFTQMQQFLVTCPEEFKKERDYHHISRIISNLYSVRKVLKQHIDSSPEKRNIHLKFFKTELSSKKDKHVLGVLVGLNLLNDCEVFEASHLVAAIQKYLPRTKAVEGSLFTDRSSLALNLYLEIAKLDGSPFSMDEITILRNNLSSQIRAHIEKLTHPIFMPRNEEEVLRNILELSRQLRSIHDLPQVTITFDEQKGAELCFTIILLRVQPESAPTVQDLFAKHGSPIPYIHDRVRRVGHIRKKYVKEASVFQTKVDRALFLRGDGSIDVVKARQYIFGNLSALIGQIRDYNGGMLYKQNELLEILKQSIEPANHLLLEKFYYSLSPIEMRTALDAEPLKQLFSLLLQMRSETLKKKQDVSKAMAIVVVDEAQRKIVMDKMGKQKFLVHQLVSFSIEKEDRSFLGFLLLSEDALVQKQFLAVFF